jgi:hypothetical protein
VVGGGVKEEVVFIRMRRGQMEINYFYYYTTTSFFLLDAQKLFSWFRFGVEFSFGLWLLGAKRTCVCACAVGGGVGGGRE